MSKLLVASISLAILFAQGAFASTLEECHGRAGEDYVRNLAMFEGKLQSRHAEKEHEKCFTYMKNGKNYYDCGVTYRNKGSDRLRCENVVLYYHDDRRKDCRQGVLTGSCTRKFIKLYKDWSKFPRGTCEEC